MRSRTESARPRGDRRTRVARNLAMATGSLFCAIVVVPFFWSGSFEQRYVAASFAAASLYGFIRFAILPLASALLFAGETLTRSAVRAAQPRSGPRERGRGQVSVAEVDARVGNVAIARDPSSTDEARARV